MKRILLATVLAGFSAMVSAASIEGKWKTFDEDGTAKAHIQITKSGNTFVGKVVGVEPTCKICQTQNLVGKTVLTGLKATDDANKYEGGSIFDPKSGKKYSAKATVKGSSLEVRGFLGISLVGRTQVWKRM